MQRGISSRRLLLTACCLLVLLATVSGCGGRGGEAPQGSDATLLLDFAPNGAHAGIFSAVQRGFGDAEGVALHVRVPSSSVDALKLLSAGRADFAVLDLHDLALARERGQDLVAIMPIVQRPLAAVIAQPGVTSARALEGRRVGVTGVPSDDAVLRSVVTGAGGRPARVRTTTIGFNAVASLLSRRVDAATAFWDVEGVALQRRRPGFRVFRVDDLGAPAYPELVLAATRARLRDDPALARAVVTALVRGYQRALDDPEGAVADLVAQEPSLDRGLAQAELDAVSPAFLAPHGPVGTFDLGRLRAWAGWEQRFGITRGRPDVGRMFSTAFGPRATS